MSIRLTIYAIMGACLGLATSEAIQAQDIKGALIVDFEAPLIEGIDHFDIKYNLNGAGSIASISGPSSEIPVTLKEGQNLIEAQARTVLKTGEKSDYTEAFLTSFEAKIPIIPQAPTRIQLVVRCAEPCLIDIVKAESMAL